MNYLYRCINGVTYRVAIIKATENQIIVGARVAEFGYNIKINRACVNDNISGIYDNPQGAEEFYRAHLTMSIADYEKRIKDLRDMPQKPRRIWE